MNKYRVVLPSPEGQSERIIQTPPAILVSPSPCQMNATMDRMAATAAAYSALTSSGYVVAIGTAWIVLWGIERSRRGGASRKVGAYGKMMALLDAVDAVPEAMVIAGWVATAWFRVASSISNNPQAPLPTDV